MVEPPALELQEFIANFAAQNEPMERKLPMNANESNLCLLPARAQGWLCAEPGPWGQHGIQEGIRAGRVCKQNPTLTQAVFQILFSGQ